ncbi:hypothetical protein LTR70_005286 [Exophiala xenobiotica]|uniref:AB hydrolase-1 domain-containing protein n=1 Tax=Lithohypha guttulata TaxID=1690604 RepID=A0ABR0KAG2_9EURO|nr:hypothetical protein LTR24_004910 [Lithohypha guttulata]KAK5318851.1 hypothetical protein LTR70_005286 [Exophiala xenobiotica]
MRLPSYQSKDQTETHELAVYTTLASTSPKRLKHCHTRQRSNSWGGATSRTSTPDPSTRSRTSIILPATAALPTDDALSSLVDHYSSTSEGERQLVFEKKTNSQARQESDSESFIDYFTCNPLSYRTLQQGQNLIGEYDDRDCCPPPVAGYNTINANKLFVRPATSTSVSDRPSRKVRSKISYPLDKALKPQGDSRAANSRTDLPSPDPNPSPYCPRSSYGNDSVTSLPLSTNSKLSRSKSPFRMFFSSSLGDDYNHVEPTLSKAQSFEAAHSLAEKGDGREARRFSAFVALGRISTDAERKESDARTLSSLSPSHRTDLNESLIPSRRSSLRSGPRRSSRGSKDLKSLNIDQDLIEENNETVQRIRELQQAREKRHSDWRKEAKKTEKAVRRMSLPHRSATPSPSPIRPSPSLRSSWHPKLVESPETENTPNLTATVTGIDLLSMPAFVEVAEDGPLTPTEQDELPQQDSALRRNLSVTPSTINSVSSARRHKRRISDSLRRVSLLRPSIPEGTQSIEEEVEAFLGSPRFTQKIRHPRTGRTIAFSEVGDPNGFVVFCCVGMGLTRYVTSFYDEIAKTQKLRIITPDRPGVGMTDAMPAQRSTPLAWVDDVAVICTSLGIEKFSLLAHSAGAIYALATALKMPQYLRGRIHLLAPWIPPSQLSASGRNGDVRSASLPTSHRILSFLPASFMKAANSRFLSATSASIEPRSRKERKRDGLSAADLALDPALFNHDASLSAADMTSSHGSMLPTPESSPQQSIRPLQPSKRDLSCYQAEHLRSPPQSPTPTAPPLSSTFSFTSATNAGARTPTHASLRNALTPQARQKLYDTTLTHRTWSLATLNANPAVDLIICLERRRPIGFRYTDIMRAVVIHHGAKDTRVPQENVRWLSTAMRRCELRILENESHGLMASADVMSNVLSEIGREWEEWNKVHGEIMEQKKQREIIEAEEARERERSMRKGYPRW